MTVLTWREVSAPDFRGVSDGYEAATRAMSSGLGALRGAITGIEADKVKNQSAAVLAEAAKYQGDPAKLQEDLASGAFQSKFDMRYVDPDILKTVMGRPDEILATASKQAAYNEAQKGIKASDYFRDNAAVFNGYLAAADKGPAEADAYFEANRDVLLGADSNMFRNFLENKQQISSGDLSGKGTQLGQLMTATNFSDSREDRATQMKTEELAGFLNTMLPEERLNYLNTNRDKLTSEYGIRAVNRVLSGAAQGYGGDTGGGGGSAGGGGNVAGTGTGIGGKSIYDVVLGDHAGGNKFGFNPPKPVSSMSLGEAFDYGRNVMLPATKGKVGAGDMGSSALGAYQIVSSTLEEVAPKVFGANWRSVQFTPENQDKLGKAIFDQADKSQLNKVWAGLPKADYRGMTWEQVRGEITRHESGGIDNPRGLQIAGNVVNQVNNTSPMAQAAITFQELKGDRRSAREVAVGLKKELYPDDDIGNLTQEITRIARKHKITPAMAAFALRDADNGNKNIFKRAFNWAPGSDGLSFDVDDGRLDAYVSQLSDPKTLASATVAVDAGNQAQANNAQAQQLVDSIKARIKSTEERSRSTGGNASATLSRLYQDLAAAEAARDGAAVSGARVAAAGQTDRTGQDGVPDPAPAQARRTAPPVIVAKGPAPNKAPLLLSQVAASQADAPWVRKAMADAKRTGKPLTAAEFNALLKQNGRKSPLSR